jgi:hypothetical protein
MIAILMVFCSLTFWAADNFVPLDVKEGLWEMTVTHSISGLPTMPNIPPDTLAKMTPEQRARVEAMMTGQPTTDVNKECITKEKIAKAAAFSSNRGECTRTIVSSTGSRLEVKFHCDEKQSSSDGTFVMNAIARDNVKGSMHAVNNSKGRNLTMDFTFSSKYLTADCGDVK